VTDFPHLPLHQRSREFQLFQYGPIVAFEELPPLREVRAELRMHGYRLIDVDASSGSAAGCYRQIAEQLRDPYDRDDRAIELNAFNDLSFVLNDHLRAAAAAFVITGFDALVAKEPEEAQFLDEIVREAWRSAIQGRLLGVLVHPTSAVERRVGGVFPDRWFEWWPE
jgi:hypothetical protein